MLADLYGSVVTVLSNPAEEAWYKIFIVVLLLLFAGFAWMVGKQLVRLARTPYQWWRERQAWRALATSSGWTSPATRKLAGEQDGRAWRMRTHVQGAWISDGDANAQGNLASQGQWRMRDLPSVGRWMLIPRATDEALRKKAASASGAGDAADVALATAGLAGLMLGQSWADTALNLSGSFGGEASSAQPLEVVAAGSDAFQSQYVVRSDVPARARSLITPQVEALLQALHDDADPADPFSAQYADGVLTVFHLGNFSSAARAERLCALGLALAKAVDAASATS